MMKRYLIILFGVLLGFNIYAEDFKDVENSAIDYYLGGEYNKALEVYDSIYKQGYLSSELFYNIGNCYYNLGDIANTIYFYEKALALNPSDKDIQHNLIIANSHLKNKVEVLPEVFYIKWYNSFTSLLSSDAWALISIIFFTISLIFICLFLFSKKISLRKTYFILGIILLTISLLAFMFSKNQANKIVKSNKAIIFESSMVKSSPSPEGQNLFEIDKGLKVSIKDSINSWINIRLADGKEGWIPSESLKRI